MQKKTLICLLRALLVYDSPFPGTELFDTCTIHQGIHLRDAQVSRILFERGIALYLGSRVGPIDRSDGYLHPGAPKGHSWGAIMEWPTTTRAWSGPY